MHATVKQERRTANRRCRHRGEYDRRRRVRRDVIIRSHLPLARMLAARFAGRGVPTDDLHQVAAMALLSAADRFDHRYGVRFETYATPTINGELKRYFRDRTWDLRVTNRVKEANVRVNAVVAVLEQRLGRSPTVDEIVAESGLDFETVLEAIEARVAYSCTSLESRSVRADVEGQPREWGRLDLALEAADDRVDIGVLLGRLPLRNQLLVKLHYWDGYSQGEIAQRLGISQMHVSRLLRRSLELLRVELHPCA